MVVASLLTIAFYRIDSATQSEFRLWVVLASGGCEVIGIFRTVDSLNLIGFAGSRIGRG